MLCFPAATSKSAEYQWRERSMFDLDNVLVVLPFLLLESVIRGIINSRLLMTYPSSASGRAVSQIEEPFN